MARILSVALAALALAGAALSTPGADQNGARALHDPARVPRGDGTRTVVRRAATTGAPGSGLCANQFANAAYLGSDTVVSPDFLSACHDRISKSGPKGDGTQQCSVGAGRAAILCYDAKTKVAAFFTSAGSEADPSPSSYCVDVAKGVADISSSCEGSKRQGRSVANGNGNILVFVMSLAGMDTTGTETIEQPAQYYTFDFGNIFYNATG